MRPVPCLACGAIRDRHAQCDCGNLSPAQIARLRSSHTYQQDRAQLIAAEPWCHNPDCPHTDTGTPANPLTVGHLAALAAGGHPYGPRRPLCQRCNSAEGIGGGLTTG